MGGWGGVTRAGGCPAARAGERAAAGAMNKAEEMRSSGSLSQILARLKSHVNTSSYRGRFSQTNSLIFGRK